MNYDFNDFAAAAIQKNLYITIFKLKLKLHINEPPKFVQPLNKKPKKKPRKIEKKKPEIIYSL